MSVLPPSLADALEPALPSVTREVVDAVRREVPEYAKPLEGAFGRGVTLGVSDALATFVRRLRDPGIPAAGEVHAALGRGEFRAGRTLDALQAAYRVGAATSWRRMGELAREAGADADVVAALAEAVFDFIHEIAATSVAGWSEAREQAAGERSERRAQLARRVVRGEDLAVAAADAAWEVPARVAVGACAPEHVGALALRLPAEVLMAVVDGVGCLVVPDPDGPGRAAVLSRAAARGRLALGPTGAVPDAPGSWRLAREALALGAPEAPGDHGAPGLVRADDLLVALLRARGEDLVGRMAAHRLAPLDALTPAARARLRTTALAWVRHGDAVAAARALQVHPQTVRGRLTRLRELLGDQLDDPGARLELELALGAGQVSSCS